MAARILFASAEQSFSSGVESTIGRDGHELAIVARGADALEAWQDTAPDLILLHVGLPDVSGYELVRRIRQAEGEQGHTPTVLIGPAEMSARIEGLRAGADDYVSLPVHPQELSARVRALLARYGTSAHAPGSSGKAMGRLLTYYGAKGGVGTTTLAVNTAVALHRETKRSVALVDANLQFGDHRVFLDMGLDKRSIVDACTATGIDTEVVRKVVVRHGSGIDLMLAPVAPESAELVSAERHQLVQVVEVLRSLYDYVVVDVDNRLDDHALDVIAATDTLMVVMTADLSCLKNVRLLLEAMDQIGVPPERMELVLNRNKAFTGISMKSAESVLRRPIRYQVVNDYRTAISSLNSGTPFMLNHADSPIGRAVLELARSVSGASPAPEASRAKRLVPVPG